MHDFYFLLAVLALDVGVDHTRVERTGAVEGIHGGDVGEFGRAQLAQIVAHAR